MNLNFKKVALLMLIMEVIILQNTSISAQTTIKDLDNKALFSFSIMSDNKGKSVETPEMYKCDKWIKEANDKFIIGLGDHVKDNRVNSFLDLLKNDSLWHNHFYPNIADGENEFWGYDQDDRKAGSTILNFTSIFANEKVKLRENKNEYYVLESYGGVNVHIIQLNYSDYPRDSNIAFNEDTRNYMIETLESIDKTDNDIIIVCAHTDPWLEVLSKERRLKLLAKADLILGATTHDFLRNSSLEENLSNGAISLNTGSVGYSKDSGFIQVHVLANPTRMIIQYQQTENDKRVLQKKGYAFEKIINGGKKEIDWNKYIF